MRSSLLFLLLALTMTISRTAFTQDEDKSKRASPPASVTTTITSGATITINYGQPSVKGRTIGKDLEPKEGQVWRAGANEATTFETDKPLTIGGKRLSPGKYAFFTRKDGAKWTLIFNKTWNTWGAFEYEKNKAYDVLQITVNEQKAPKFYEKLTYTISKAGTVSLYWGKMLVSFDVAS